MSWTTEKRRSLARANDEEETSRAQAVREERRPLPNPLERSAKGHEEEMMGYCRKCINKRATYALLTNDCHNACDDVLKALGYGPPPLRKF